MAKPFYRTEKNGRVVLYGPFASGREAASCGVFSRSDAELALGTKTHHLESYLFQGVSFYDDDDIASLVSDPGSCFYKSVKVKPATALQAHPDWKGRDLKFLADYYFKDLA
jgi:hypothetical protein